jgi:hypothetical protein
MVVSAKTGINQNCESVISRRSGTTRGKTRADERKKVLWNGKVRERRFLAQGESVLDI